MRKFNKLTTGTIEEGKAQMVFAILYATDGQPYEKYDQIDKELRSTKIPVTLMQVRWDGYIGFPGGKVDPGEDLLTAVKREISEEIQYEIESDDELIPFTTYASEKSNIHSFLVPVSYSEIKEIQKNSLFAEHFMAENCGCILPHLAKYEGDRGVMQFLNNNFIATAKLELEALLTEVLKIDTF